MGGSISFGMVSTSPARRIPVILAAATLLWAASGCSSSPKADNQSAEPATGSIAASDVYRPPPWEKVYREGDKLILDERFVYSDGERQRRVWTLTPDGPARWRGTAGDVIGEARGELAGNALRWQYRLLLPVDDTTYEVDFDDWMYLMDEDTLINRSSMLKLGVELGQVTLFFRRQP